MAPLTKIDAIDRLDSSVPPTLQRHNSGPYDAASQASNHSRRYTPLEAVADSNAAALAATPKGNIIDSLKGHMPLDGTASTPPGTLAIGDDEPLDYEEENLEREVGRWPGVEYYDDDRRGRGKDHYPDSEHAADKWNKSPKKKGKSENCRAGRHPLEHLFDGLKRRFASKRGNCV